MLPDDPGLAEPPTPAPGWTVLVAEDDPVSLAILEHALARWGFGVETCRDGSEAWRRIDREDLPPLVLLDWMMPGVDGVELCRRLRNRHPEKTCHVILVTSRLDKADIVAGLSAGADDYLTKPVHLAELKARLQVGVRIAELQHRLSDRVRELEAALNRIRVLQGLLPICMYCKRIRDVRDDQQYWRQVESYLSEHADVSFSHGVCPECYDAHVLPELTALRAGHKRNGPVTA